MALDYTFERQLELERADAYMEAYIQELKKIYTDFDLLYEKHLKDNRYCKYFRKEQLKSYFENA